MADLSEEPASDSLDAESTLELDLQDVEVEEARPVAGRVAFPIGKEQPARPHRPAERNETKAAGLPPQPPQEAAPLGAQVHSLRQLAAFRRRQLWQQLGGGLTGVAAVGLIAAAVWWRWSSRSLPASELAAPTADAASPRGAPRAGAPRVGAPLGVMTRDTQPPARDPAVAAANAAVAAANAAVPARDAAAPGAAVRPASLPARSRRVVRAPRAPAAPKISSEEAEALYRSGLQQLLAGEAEAAVASFKQALRGNPQLVAAYRGLGLALEKAGRREMAREAFKSYLELRPTAPDADAIRRKMGSL